MFLPQKGALLAKDHGEIFVFSKGKYTYEMNSKDKYQPWMFEGG